MRLAAPGAVLGGLLLGGCSLLGGLSADPTPMTVSELGVGTERFALILAVSEGEDAEDPDFQSKVKAAEAAGAGPVMVTWLGCQPEYVKIMDGSERRWVATVSHKTLPAQDAWLQKHRIQPLAGVLDTVEPCGD